MKHARTDYDARIQDSAGLIPADEPVFLLRAQDVAAPLMLARWIDFMQNTGAQPELIDSAKAHLERMEAWQREHGSKTPDLP